MKNILKKSIKMFDSYFFYLSLWS